MAVTMMSQDLEAGFSFAQPQEACAISELCRSDQPEVWSSFRRALCTPFS
jgi:hypothetical protein